MECKMELKSSLTLDKLDFVNASLNLVFQLREKTSLLLNLDKISCHSMTAGN